jgi:hypothetical protein
MARSAPFKILIVYEPWMAYATLGVAVRPHEMSERLAGVLRSHCETECDLWTFELLRHPRLRDWAATEAGGANMIIIAARGDKELPDHVKAWIESWLPQRREGLGILVGILGEEAEPPGETRLCACLRQMAEKGHMRFFSQADRWSQLGVEHKDEIIADPPEDEFALGSRTSPAASPVRQAGSVEDGQVLKSDLKPEHVR